MRAGCQPWALSNRQLLHSLGRMPFVDTTEVAGILSEAPATIHRGLTGLPTDGIAGPVSHGTAHLPSSWRYHLTAKGVGEAARTLSFETSSDFVCAYPIPWLQMVVEEVIVHRNDNVVITVAIPIEREPNTEIPYKL